MPKLRRQGWAVKKAIKDYPDASCVQIARLLGVSRNTVVRWRNLTGLVREPHPAKIGWPVPGLSCMVDNAEQHSQHEEFHGDQVQCGDP